MYAHPADIAGREAVRAFTRAHAVSSGAINSFNRLASVGIPGVVAGNPEILATAGAFEHRIRIDPSSVRYRRPSKLKDGVVVPLYPHEAEERGVPYEAPVLATVEHVLKEGGATRKHTVYRDVRLFALPVLRGSSLCWLSDAPVECLAHQDPLDPLGDFIVGRGTKFMVMQDRRAHNLTVLDPCKANGVTGGRSQKAQYRSHDAVNCRSTATINVTVSRVSDRSPLALTADVPFLDATIPFAVLIVFLGCASPDQFLAEFWRDHEPDGAVTHALVDVLEEVGGVDGREDALRLIVQRCGKRADVNQGGVRNQGVIPVDASEEEKRSRAIKHIISSEVMCNITGEMRNDRRRMALMCMAHDLVTTFCNPSKPFLSRDHLAARAVDTPGVTFAYLIRQLYGTWCRNFRSQLMRSGELANIQRIMKRDSITQALRYVLATGNCTASMNVSANQRGVFQHVTPNSLVTRYSLASRVRRPVFADTSDATPRQLDSSSCGRLCIAESPEGKQIGFVCHRSVLTMLRTPVLTEEFVGAARACVSDLLDELTLETPPTAVLVFANGAPVFSVAEGASAAAVVDAFRRMRGTGVPSFDFGVWRDEYGVQLRGDAGVLVRPLVRAESFKEYLRCCVPGVQFNTLLMRQLVELVEVTEELRCYTVLSDHWCVEEGGVVPEGFTHVEVHPAAALMGWSASTIPLPNHCQGPRNSYQSAMTKQSHSYLCFPPNKFATGSHMQGADRPLLESFVSTATNVGGRATGQTCVVAITTYDGCVEDALIVKKGFLDRGGMRTEQLWDVVDDCLKGEVWRKPTAATRGLSVGASFAHLNAEGFPTVGKPLAAGDVLFAKVEKAPDGTERDRSVEMKSAGIVVRIRVVTNRDGGRRRIAQLRHTTPLQTGDKLATRHAQKGVVGAVVPDADLPFSSETGIIPDIIINPHAIPSRLTINLLLEQLLSKAKAMDPGLKVDGTPFVRVDMEAVKRIMLRHGHMIGKDGEDVGKESFIDGKTGEPIRHPITMGLVYYQALKHKAADKLSARAKGPVNVLTRQPLEGRSRIGGFRVGEMEQLVIQVHGASQFLLERCRESSDIVTLPVCSGCGMHATRGRDRPDYCRACSARRRDPAIVTVKTCYAFQLLLRELQGVGITVRMKT